MSHRFHMSTALYVLALGFTTTALVLDIPTVMFEPTWGTVLRALLLLVAVVSLCLAHPRFSQRTSPEPTT